MNTKQMRDKLREDGHKVPRSNSDLLIEYNTYYGKTEHEPTVSIIKSNVYTYIGKGDTPPHVINFMGQQIFVRGEPTEAPLHLIDKIKTNPCFVKGKYDMKLAHENDKAERERAEKRNLENLKIDQQIKRRNGN